MSLLEKPKKKDHNEESSIISFIKKGAQPKETEETPVITQTVSEPPETFKITKPIKTTSSQNKNFLNLINRKKTPAKPPH